MNPLGIGGILLVILGIIIFFAPNLLNYIVAIVFIIAGGFLAYQAFGTGR